jgi:hypothetical protein
MIRLRILVALRSLDVARSSPGVVAPPGADDDRAAPLGPLVRREAALWLYGDRIADH